MDIKTLIQEGEQVKKNSTKEGTIAYISGAEYENWIAKCVIFLERKNYNKVMTQRFIEASKHAVGNDVKYFNTMIGILKAFDELGEEEISF